MRFTDEQNKFLQASESLMLLDAPAGSGKTETVAERVRLGVEAGKRVLLSCFTHSARVTLQNRLAMAGIFEPVRTVSSLAYEIVTDEFGPMDVGDGYEVAVAVCARTPVAPRDLLLLESLTLNGAPLPDSLPSVTGEVFADYQKRKQELGYATFADLIVAATGLQSMDWDELVVDEAQDLTPTQLRLLESFGISDMILVGDPHQSIYGFSGVDADLFQKLEDGGWTSHSLTKSFRVPSGILPAVNVARSVPLTSVRGGGTILADYVDASDLARFVGEQVEVGDVVIAYSAKQLSKLATYLAAFRPDVPLSFSWQKNVESAGTVHLSTAHSAKGGEWGRVWLLYVSETGLWSPMSSDDEAARKRLFYVAASRASDELRLVQTVEGDLPWGLVV